MQDESKVTRRVFFKGAATLAGAALVAAIPIRDARAQAKIAQAAVKYQDTPKDGLRCDACVYWKAPDACGIVEGKIAPSGWCAAFNQKKS